jgi:hypothetical protein
LVPCLSLCRALPTGWIAPLFRPALISSTCDQVANSRGSPRTGVRTPSSTTTRARGSTCSGPGLMQMRQPRKASRWTSIRDAVSWTSRYSDGTPHKAAQRRATRAEPTRLLENCRGPRWSAQSAPRGSGRNGGTPMRTLPASSSRELQLSSTPLKHGRF